MNKTEAAKWWKKSSNQGNESAKQWLNKMMYDGDLIVYDEGDPNK